MPTDFWLLFSIGALVIVALFIFTWWLSLRLDNFSFVDITWSYSLAILAPLYAWLGHGYIARKALACCMAFGWSIRLGSYLLLRIRRHHPHEDARYQVLRAKWQGSLARRFFAFFQAQAVLILLLSVPVLLACLNDSPTINAIEWMGFVLWLIAYLGETFADAQMQQFKSDLANKGKVCQVGLWHYSRHPNYFFESLIWWGFWLFACGSPLGWMTIYAPLMILYFLLRVTGIPLTEKCAVESKGDAYRDYQRSTSAFIPWPRCSTTQAQPTSAPE